MSLITSILHINLLAVLIAGITHLILNLVWFMPVLFGRAWEELTKKDMKPAPRWIPAAILGHLLITLILAALINLAGAATILDGMLVAGMAWIGFVVTLETGELVWEKIPFKLFLIRVGNQLFSLCIAGAILAVWR